MFRLHDIAKFYVDVSPVLLNTRRCLFLHIYYNDVLSGTFVKSDMFVEPDTFWVYKYIKLLFLTFETIKFDISLNTKPLCTLRIIKHRSDYIGCAWLIFYSDMLWKANSLNKFNPIIHQFRFCHPNSLCSMIVARDQTLPCRTAQINKIRKSMISLI